MNSRQSKTKIVIRILGVIVGVIFVTISSFAYIVGVMSLLNLITSLITGFYFLLYGLTGSTSIVGHLKKHPSPKPGERNSN